jgi:hypothetical protein
MRRTLLSTLVVALLLGGRSVCPAQVTPSAGLKPLVTVSFAGYDRLRTDLEFIGKLSNNPQLAQGLEGMLKMATQGQGLAGLDTKRPWGAVIQTDGQQRFSIYGFIPVTDLKQLLGVVRNVPVVKVTENPADGVYEIQTPGPTLFLQQKGGWAFITNSRPDLATMPADPQKLLQGLNEKYDLAVRASIKNVPPIYRQMFTAQLQAGAEIGMQPLPGESDEDFALRQGLAKRAIQQLNTMVNELDEVLLGWAIDSQAGTSYLDFQVTALPGSKTAAQFARGATATTNFAGFDLPGAAVTGSFAGKLTDEDVAEAKNAIANVRVTAQRELKNQGLSPDELKLASQLLSDLLAVVENKTADAGMVLLLKPGALTLAAGGTIADGAKLEKALKQLAAEMQKRDPNLSQLLKLDAETYQGVRFHTLAIPTNEFNDEVATKLFGPTLNVVLGVSDTSVYLSAGRDALSTLKQVIDQSKAQPGKQIPPARISLAATPIAKFVAEVAQEDEAKQVAAKVAAMLEQSAGKDHLVLTSKPVPNGTMVRLEAQEGLLKVVGLAGQMIGPPVGAPGLPGGAAPANSSPF